MSAPVALPSCCENWQQVAARANDRAERAERALRLLSEAVSLVLAADPDKTEALREMTK